MVITKQLQPDGRPDEVTSIHTSTYTPKSRFPVYSFRPGLSSRISTLSFYLRWKMKWDISMVKAFLDISFCVIYHMKGFFTLRSITILHNSKGLLYLSTSKIHLHLLLRMISLLIFLYAWHIVTMKLDKSIHLLKSFVLETLRLHDYL